MKQFNLDEYIKNPKKKVVTRDGRSVRIICTDHDNVSYPIVGAIKGYDFPFCFGEDGYVVGSKCNDANDLFFATERKEGWANLYRGNIDYIGGCVYTSKEEAEENIGNKETYVATIKIEWEE